MKFCINCEYYNGAGSCLHPMIPKEVSAVQGEQMANAYTERRIEPGFLERIFPKRVYCGPDGNLFKPRKR